MMQTQPPEVPAYENRKLIHELKCLMLFKCLFEIAIEIAIGIEHVGVIVLFDFDPGENNLSC